MSLRGRVVALVVGAVLLTLLAMALPGRRIALQEFEASVKAIVLEASDDAGAPLLPLRPPDLDAFAEEIRAAEGDERQIWVTVSGEVRASNDPAMETAAARRTPDGMIELEHATAQGLERIRLGGGVPVEGPSGNDAGRLFRLPTTDDVTRRGRDFSRALDRRLLAWAALIVAVGTGLAIALVGQLLGPVRRLGDAASRIAVGDLRARVGPGGPPEIRAVAESFDRMAAHLEASEEARTRMIRNVAHDLRTPLTNLQGQIEALQDGLTTLDEAALASLHEETVLLSHLVHDVERLARADEGRLELRPESVDLVELVEHVIGSFVKSGRLDPDGVARTLPPSLPAFVDRAAVGRALRNVVDNAIVHAPGASIEVRGRALGDCAVVEVRDHGPGIDGSHLPHVTERLYRADPARGRATGGSGLGLAIAVELVQACGGSLTVDNAETGGVRIRIELPARPHAEPGAGDRRSADEGQPSSASA